MDLWRDSSETSGVLAAVQRAESAGIFVVTCNLRQTHGLSFHGLGRSPMADPNLTSSYGPGSWWAQMVLEGAPFPESDILLVPLDSRCTAARNGPTSYVFFRTAGWSWCVPYITGAYALACQVNPGATPQSFWRAALDTGTPLYGYTSKGLKQDLGRIINPVALMEKLADRDIVPGVGYGRRTSPLPSRRQAGQGAARSGESKIAILRDDRY